MSRLVRSILLATLVAGAAPATAQTEFVAVLSGAGAVPPVDTTAFGRATFDFNLSGGTAGVNFTVSANNLKTAYAATLRCRVTDAQIVTLTKGPFVFGAGVDIDGTWVSNAKFKRIFPSDCGTDLRELFDAMTNGLVDVAVSTWTIVDGNFVLRDELRGRVLPVPTP